MMIGMRRFGLTVLAMTLLAAPRATHANDVWVAPTSQQDLGGSEVASNTFWPVTPIGAVRLALAVPGDLQTFQSAKISLIAASSATAAVLTVYVCAASANQSVNSACAGPFAQSFSSVANQLTEVDISGAVAGHLGTPGASYVTLLAYTSPTTVTDHVLGLRFTYAPHTPAGVATLAANTFTGTQVAPAFVGDGSGLTNIPPGPPGAPGTPGAPGAPGAPGPAGPSDAFTRNTFAGNVNLSTIPAAVSSLSLGPGSYVFIASVRLLSTTATASNADCFIQPIGLANSNFSNVNVDGNQDRKIVSLNYAVTLASANTVQLNCEITAGGAVKADEVFFTAIKVQTVTQQ
jgi:hypothetical protein